MRVWVAGVAVCALALAACSSGGHRAASTPPGSAASSPSPSAGPTVEVVKVSVATTGKGKVLTGPTGHVLYVYDADTATSSTCTGGCATNWPPLVGTASPGAGLSADEFGTIVRPDGSPQVTYDHHPLYYFTKDKGGEVAYGDGIGGLWHVAKVGSSSVSVSPSSPGGRTY